MKDVTESVEPAKEKTPTPKKNTKQGNGRNAGKQQRK
jgi:hypothetical protein